MVANELGLTRSHQGVQHRGRASASDTTAHNNGHVQVGAYSIFFSFSTCTYMYVYTSAEPLCANLVPDE